MNEVVVWVQPLVADGQTLLNIETIMFVPQILLTAFKMYLDDGNQSYSSAPVLSAYH